MKYGMGLIGLFTLLIVGCVSTNQGETVVMAGNARDRSFDAGWLFLRGDATGAEQPAFDDAGWRTLDVPHDWSIEDLPPRTNVLVQLDAVTGEWLFHTGDNEYWSARELDESGWEKVALPATWERHSGYTNDNAFGWYRRRIDIPVEFKGQDVDLLLGYIDDADETFLNGERIGGTGSMPPEYQSAWSVERRYRIPAKLVHGDGSDVLAVRVYDGNNDGGLYAASVVGERIGPFDPAESPSKHFTGNTIGGIGWYRKHFTLDEPGKHVAIRFDGVYMNAEVWVNGHLLGSHPHGYTAFKFDLTPYLNPVGEENVLAVKVRNEGRNSRWYSGSGIYRHVWLTVTEPVHIPTWGVFVTTPEISKDNALVKISSEVANASDKEQSVNVTMRVFAPNGNLIGKAGNRLQLPAKATCFIEESITVLKPELWSVESPALYSAEVELDLDEDTSDLVSVPFGIRSIDFSAEKGFLLNGEPLLLKGGCIHHDNGPLGAAAIDRAEERKVELLKANGYNAIRSAHNPPSSALLESCDRLGMLMIDEAFDQWNESKESNDQDYHRFFDAWCEHDIAAMVRRDRNHPCVILWSIGNEIPEQFRAVETQKRLRDAVLLHDTSRPVSQAICNDWDEVTANWEELSDPAFTYLDVGGYNYLPERYEADHARNPDRVMYCSESFAKDAFDYWEAVEKHSYLIGDFVWTAMDYLGEAGIGHALMHNESTAGLFMPWPYIDAWCGDLDIAGFKKPQSFYRDVVWRRSPIEMAVHAPIPEGYSEVVSAWGWPNEIQSWNWPGQEGSPLQVRVFSRCEMVRLELNGKVIGEQAVSGGSKLIASFDVPYEPGELKAYAISNGAVVAETTLKTSGAPKALKLTADRATIHANRNDLSYVTVEVVDAHGQRVPNAEIEIHFTLDGVGELAGQASGAPNKPASFQAPVCTTFKGRCVAILRPTGTEGQILLKANGEGLAPSEISVSVQK